MPITKSAKKALRQSLRRKERNLIKKEAYKKTVKEITKLAAAGNRDQAKTLIPNLYKALDKAAKTRAIHSNKAARLKSRLAKIAARTNR